MTPLLSFITGAAIATLCLAIARRRHKRCLLLLTDAGTSLVMSLRLAHAAERKAKAKAKAKAARPACPVLPPATQELPAWGDSGRWWKTRRPVRLTPRAK